MSENPLFRKAALDKLASPERLDVLMKVTSPMGWLSLLTVAGILVGVIIWSILGSIPERIDGQGVLLRGGANTEIRATGQGIVESLDLKLGQVVSSGQIVGTARQEGDKQIDVIRTRLSEARTRYSNALRDSGQGTAQIMGQIAVLKGELGRLQAEHDAAEANVARLQALFDKGEIPASRLEQAKATR